MPAGMENGGELELFSQQPNPNFKVPRFASWLIWKAGSWAASPFGLPVREWPSTKTLAQNATQWPALCLTSLFKTRELFSSGLLCSYPREGNVYKYHPSVSWRFLEIQIFYQHRNIPEDNRGRVWKLHFLERHTRKSETS